MITKPMLAGKCEDLSQLKFPLLATPKLDGIRCLTIKGKAVSRKFKPIPNDHIRTTIESGFAGYVGEFDGEIITYEMVKGVRTRKSFNDISGDVRRKDGTPDFNFMVFDRVNKSVEHGGLSQAYQDRMKALQTLSLPAFCVKLLPVTIKDLIELETYEADQLLLDYEGVMVRSLQSPYKCGRSTVNEGYLLKIKQFSDDEAEVVGYEELMHNDNVAMRDAFGRTERSSRKENLRPAGVLGKLVCKTKAGVIFGLGTGYDVKTRAELWAARDGLVGRLVKYRHQPSGAAEKPRFPSFLAFRDSYDMSDG